MSRKVVLCGTGFVGGRIAHAISKANRQVHPHRLIQASSRTLDSRIDTLKRELPANDLLPFHPVDITKPETLAPAFDGADVVVSLVGLLTGSPDMFERVQWKGNENVAVAAKEAGAKLIYISAIGADRNSPVPYARTKALAEEAVLQHCPDATIIRPSLVFGPGDSFFNRFATLSKFLPFLPVFGDGSTKFQPVFVDDIAHLVEIISRQDPAIRAEVAGRIIEAGGPDVFSFKDIMHLVLRHTGRTRPVVPVPWAVGTIQGAVLERLPETILTMTRDQVEQLKKDNVVVIPTPSGHINFKYFMRMHGRELTSVEEVLPTYLSA
ncbi:NAD-P-binding protein [Peniophora sp. CONT]|nr:NAD-P-binding protein [Peniophora sp. CONT]